MGLGPVRAPRPICFIQLSRMGSSDILFADAPLPLFKTVTLTLAEYYYWLGLVQLCGSKPTPCTIKTSPS
ncbi:hypothetical protein GY26_19315 [Gammaproteobacteria bacterium MFB021]|nr:hypothetical protein GY26_19315 [Gammaproteobacteria bacterium MFB021]